jgi:hypothetical protein
VTNIDELLLDFRQAGVEFWIDGLRLRYRAPMDRLDDSLRARIRSFGPAIYQRLKQSDGAVRRSDRTKAPLSFTQTRLWFLEKLGNLGTTYHLPAIVRMEGRLVVPALEHAIDQLIRRHEILRTRFEPCSDPGVTVVQVIEPG